MGIGTAPVKVRPRSVDCAMTACPTELRWSDSGHWAVGAGRASGKGGFASRGVGEPQWFVQKNAETPPPLLTPPEGTLKYPCKTCSGPVTAAGVYFGPGSELMVRSGHWLRVGAVREVIH